MFYNFGILWKKSGILVSHYPPAGPDSLCSIELLMATDQGGVQFWREITNMKLNKNLIALKEQKKAATKAEKGTASSMWKLTTNGFLVLIKTGVTRESTVMIFNNFFFCTYTSSPFSCYFPYDDKVTPFRLIKRLKFSRKKIKVIFVIKIQRN